MSSTHNWLTIALNEVGQQEIAGSDHNPRIVEYHQSTSLAAKDDETPWCASFVSWVVRQAGFPNPNTARALDFANYGQRLERPQHGCIVVFNRQGGGHVGFYMGERGDKILLLGGNQNNRVSIAPYNKSQVVAYRWPPGVPKEEPETMREAAQTGTVQGAVDQGLLVGGVSAIGTVLTSLGAVPVPVALALIVAAVSLGIYWIASKRLRKAKEN
jgi:uncharacterized protein (TIGR02594 family)